MKNIVYVFFLTLTSLYAQTKNVFLDREFWKRDPSISLVKMKISEGNDPTQLNGNAFDAVTYALLENSDTNVIKYLLEIPGNDVNKLTHDGRTYIFWAAYRNNLEMMRHLLSKRAKTTIIDSHGYSVLNFAASTGQTDPKLYDFIINECNADPLKEKNRNGANALLLVLPHLKNYQLADYFIEKGLDINSLDNDGNGAFIYAASSGNKEILKILLQKGLPYKNVNKKGGNAMLRATQGSRRGYNSLEFFKYLEGLGITPNVTNSDGKNPLHNLSFSNNDIATLNYFISKGVDINKADKEGNTPLLNAAARNSLEVIKLFSKPSSTINHLNKDGHSALTKAISNSPEVVGHLLEKGADATVVDKKGNHLGYYLIHSYNAEKKQEFKTKLKLLTSKGMSFLKAHKSGNSPYHLALEKNDIELLELLKDFNINLDLKNKNGETALHQAAMTAKNTTILKYLIAKGANKNIKTDFGESVFDLAKENEVLTQSKADLNFLK